MEVVDALAQACLERQGNGSSQRRLAPDAAKLWLSLRHENCPLTKQCKDSSGMRHLMQCGFPLTVAVSLSKYGQ